MADENVKAIDTASDLKSAPAPAVVDAPIANMPAPMASSKSIAPAAAAKQAAPAVAKPAAPAAAPSVAKAIVKAPAPAKAQAPAPEKAPAPTKAAAPLSVAAKNNASAKSAPASAAKKSVSVKTAVKVPVPVKTKPVAVPTARAIPTPKKVTIMENTVKNTSDKAQAMFVDMNDRAKAALEKTQGLFADVTEFNKGNVEAIVESSKIAAKGIETMGQDAAEYTRKSFESMTAIVKTLSTVKSPTEFMKLHSDYMRTSFDSMVAESSKTTETMLKLAGEIAQPISNRVAIAAEKIKISA